MNKKSIIAVVAIIAAIVLVFAASGAGNNGGNKPLNTSGNQEEKQQTQNIDSKNSDSQTTKTDNTKISASEAQEIAQNFIKDEGAKAGSPKLGKINGNNVYFVPVIKNNQTVGEINIDAQTGRNTGGAGAP